MTHGNEALRTQHGAYTIHCMKTVNAREARTRFAEILEDAQAEPIVITKHGKPLAVITGAANAANVIAIAPAPAAPPPSTKKRKKA